MNKINLADKFQQIKSYWDPKIVGELNNQHIKLVKFSGEFIWHKHDHEDEMFFVIKGSFNMKFRHKTIPLTEGEFIIVPKGMEHCPQAENEVHVLLFEPVTTINTGNQTSELTVLKPEKI
jgi:mannose-6-phosphate isomerase-like protein (cupin superfamily)